MKRTLLTLVSLILILTAKAQLTDSARNSNANVFVAVEKVPEYPGGLMKLYNFLQTNLQYPPTARQNKTQGNVIVSMVVERDGSLSQVKAQRGIGDGCDEEAVRLVKLSAPWKPGIQNGRSVRVAFSLPVKFQLKGQ
jgi:protein TonB